MSKSGYMRAFHDFELLRYMQFSLLLYVNIFFVRLNGSLNFLLG